MVKMLMQTPSPDRFGRSKRRNIGSMTNVLIIAMWTLTVFLIGIDAQIAGWPPTPPEDSTLVDRAANYVVGLLNLRGILLLPTTLERIIASYKAPPIFMQGQLLPQRYWLALQVSEVGNVYTLTLETYQDRFRNWVTILPSPSKNFKALDQPLSHDLLTEVWQAHFMDEEVVISALQAARLLMERSYFPLTIPDKKYVFQRLLHAESREEVVGEASQMSVQRRVNELRSSLAAVETEKRECANRLSRSLAAWRDAVKTASERQKRGVTDDQIMGELHRLRELADKDEKDFEALHLRHRRVSDALQDANAELTDMYEPDKTDTLRQTTGSSQASVLSLPTYVFLVCEFVDEASLQQALVPNPNPTLIRRQIVMFSSDWRRFGTTGWSLMQHHEFDLALPLSVLPLPSYSAVG